MSRQRLAVMSSSKGHVRHLAPDLGRGPYYSLCGWKVEPMKPPTTRAHTSPKFYSDCARCAYFLLAEARGGAAGVVLMSEEHYKVICQFPQCPSVDVIWADALDMVTQLASSHGWQADPDHAVLCPVHKAAS
jgi:hypothetical protein